MPRGGGKRHEPPAILVVACRLTFRPARGSHLSFYSTTPLLHYFTTQLLRRRFAVQPPLPYIAPTFGKEKEYGPAKSRSVFDVLCEVLRGTPAYCNPGTVAPARRLEA